MWGLGFRGHGLRFRSCGLKGVEGLAVQGLGSGCLGFRV